MSNAEPSSSYVWGFEVTNERMRQIIELGWDILKMEDQLSVVLTGDV